MDIRWLGHSCFYIKGKTVSVVTDPYPEGIGYTMGDVEADIVTISHQHPNHSCNDAVGGEPKFINGPGEYEIKEVLIIGVDTFHDNDKGINRGKNTAYIIDTDELSLCHLGDLGHMLTVEQLEELGPVDILFVPVGGATTIDAKTAAELVRSIEPKIVIPMHYRLPDVENELEPIDGFLKEMGIPSPVPQPKISVAKSSLPDRTQVTLLDCH